MMMIKNLPSYIQVVLGIGDPITLQLIITSFPSNTVAFFGGLSMTGDVAKI
jgi:hypothetical protein